MALSVGFDSGLKALLTSQAALQTIGNNIANANTPGFARQQVLLSASMPLSIGGFAFGTGVDVARIRRIVDDGLEQKLLAHGSVLSRLRTETWGLRQLEGILSSAGGSGISSGLGNVFTSLASLSAHPEDAVGRKEVLTNGDALAAALREARNRLGAFRGDQKAYAEIRVQEANSLTTRIAAVNRQISSLTAKGMEPHSLLDQRQQLLGELSQVLEITTIDDGKGSIRVLAAGHSIVSGDKSFDLALTETASGELELRVKGAVGAIALGSGAVAGLLKLHGGASKQLTAQLDLFTRALVLAVNRVHSTGVPASGGFAALTATSGPALGAAGAALPLSSAGTPFPVTAGDLYVTLTHKTSGTTEVTKVKVDPNESLLDFAAKLSSIPNLSASVDGEGKLRIAAAPGYQFGFSGALDPNPDPNGAFGGASAAVTAGSTGPFSLTNGASLQVSVDGGAPQTITFTAGQFANLTAATAEEVASAINAQLTGAKAVVTNGILTIVSDTTGAASSIQVTDGGGSPNAVLGFSTALDTGASTEAAVHVTGSYSGASNDLWTFKPDADGTIGVTPGLTIGVFDGAGNRVATLDVGPNYAPGTEIEVKDGVKVSFGPAVLSSSANDSFALHVVSDPDTSDVLVALGLNTFFTGTDASDVRVREDLLANPDLFASALAGGAGDGGNVNRLLALQDFALDDLDDRSLTAYLSNMTANLGFDVKRATDLADGENALLKDLTLQREQVSGVSLEEEMANLVRFQQAFDAAGRYLRVLQDANATLLDMLR